MKKFRSFDWMLGWFSGCFMYDPRRFGFGISLYYWFTIRVLFLKLKIGPFAIEVDFGPGNDE